MEKTEDLRNYSHKLDLNFDIVKPGNDTMLVDFGIRQRSTKVAIGRDGIIVYRDEYGKGSPESWVDVLTKLAQTKDPLSE